MCCPAENWLASYPVVGVVKKREDRLAEDGHSGGCSEERERDEPARQHWRLRLGPSQRRPERLQIRRQRSLPNRVRDLHPVIY